MQLQKKRSLHIDLIIKGIAIGISVSAPLGPIGVLCIQKTLNRGMLAGFVSGMGAAAADTLFAAIAGFGLTFVSDFLTTYQEHLRILGGVALIIIGIKVFNTNTIKQIRRQRKRKSRIIGEFISVFFLTLSNPITIIFFGAVFAGLGLLDSSNGTIDASILVTSIFVGTLIWWISLAFTINFFRKKIRLRSLWWINKIAGVLIFLLGILTVGSLFFLETANKIAQ